MQRSANDRFEIVSSLDPDSPYQPQHCPSYRYIRPDDLQLHKNIKQAIEP